MKPKDVEKFEARLQGLSEKYDTPYTRELRFHPTRKWRFDGAFPDKKIACEVDGGAFIGGRHTRGPGFISDQEKCNEAALLGWTVFRFVTADLGKDNETSKLYDVLDRALGGGATSET